jgi:hypothetical protein
MYSIAFVENDVDSIIREALKMIPEESSFYQCIADVTEWYKLYPDDWRKNWKMIEEKWGLDIGCPDGAFEDFNIDAKINAAYVVLGLLYGDDDFGKTMEIATRAGQDSDCNPATAAAILGTVYGYEKIPEYWSAGLSEIEDMDFEFTSTSLNDVYDISFRHALEMIKRNGGEVKEEEVRIKPQDVSPAPLEQSFMDYDLLDNISIHKRIGFHDKQEMEINFEGIGVVLKGRVRHVDHDEKYALLTSEETLDNYKLSVDFYIDDQLSKTMVLPIYFIERAHELFFQYELPNGRHTLKLIINNPHEKIYLDIWNMITYKKAVS